MKEEFSRRDMFLSAGALAAMGLLTGVQGGAAYAGDKQTATSKGGTIHKLPPMPYPADALEPVIDKQTVEIHFNKHFAGYIKGLNATLAKLEKARSTGDYSAIKALSRDLAFHGSGVVLHWIYFSHLGQNPSPPSDETKKMLERDFGSVDSFWAQFNEASKKVEGSGWGILAWEPFSKRFVIMQAEKHQNLTSWGVMPILVCDVWEHAYYLKYQNRRAEYVDNFKKIVDWKKVEAFAKKFCKV